MGLNKKTSVTGYVAIGGVAMLLLSLVSCKGRTTDNVVPTGDTVEVVINQPDETPDNGLIFSEIDTNNVEI